MWRTPPDPHARREIAKVVDDRVLADLEQLRMSQPDVAGNDRLHDALDEKTRSIRIAIFSRTAIAASSPYRALPLNPDLLQAVESHAEHHQRQHYTSAALGSTPHKSMTSTSAGTCKVLYALCGTPTITTSQPATSSSFEINVGSRANSSE